MELLWIMMGSFALFAAFTVWVLWRRGYFGRKSVKPQAPPRLTEDELCVVCKKRQAEVLMPKQMHRRQDHVLNPHAERDYGLPPRPMIGAEEGMGAQLCKRCAPTCLRVLEAFLAQQYGAVSELVRQQSIEAAEFEGHRLVEAARAALHLGDDG